MATSEQSRDADVVEVALPPQAVNSSALQPPLDRPVVEPGPAQEQSRSKVAAELDDRELLLQVAAKHPLSLRWVIDTLAMGTAEACALLESMVDDGLLRRSNQSSGTWYAVADKAESTLAESERAEKPPPVTRRVLTPEQRTRVLQAAQHRPLSSASIRGILGVDTGQAVQILAELAQEGLLKPRNSGGEHPDNDYILVAPATRRAPASGPASAPVPASDVAVQFEREMRRLYERTLKETGYRATRFLSLISEHGGVATAHQLLAAGSVSGGFTELWERRRLDLTVEALVLQSRFELLFRDSERETARYRLSAHAYVLPDGDG